MRIKKSYVIAFLFWGVILLISFTTNKGDRVLKFDGGPPYNTKAPGEKTCSGPEGNNACHSGGAGDNTGPGTPAITFNGGTTWYVPGQTYVISPSILHPNRIRFGFQLVALRSSNNLPAGTITITDTTNTRSQYPGYGSYQTRQYAMHRQAGTLFTGNKGQWAFNWTAPSTNVGNITLYACFVAANNNIMNDSLDEVYYTKLELTPSLVGMNDKAAGELNIFPNPFQDVITIDRGTGSVTGSGETSFLLFDLSGKEVMNLPVTGKQIHIDRSKVPPGMYLYQLREGAANLQSGKLSAY